MSYLISIMTCGLTTSGGDGNVKLMKNINNIEVATVLSVRRWLDGEHVSKCAPVAKRLRKTNQTLGSGHFYFETVDSSPSCSLKKNNKSSTVWNHPLELGYTGHLRLSYASWRTEWITRLWFPSSSAGSAHSHQDHSHGIFDHCSSASGLLQPSTFIIAFHVQFGSLKTVSRQFL